MLFQTSNLKAEFQFLQDWKLEFKPYFDNSQEVGALIYARFTFNFVLSFEVIREWVNTGVDFGVVVSHLRSKNYSLHCESVSKEAFGIFALFALRAPKEEPSDLRQPVDLSYVVVPLSKSFPHPLAKIKTDIPDLVGVDKPYSALHRYLRAHSVSICDETDILYYRPIFIDYGLDGEYRRYG